jgi:uncharacterized membrane protein
MMFYLAIAIAVGGGLIAGTFFIFSVAIMEAFRRLPANEGMAAMQSINVVIQNPIFLGVFMGTALLSLVASVFAVLNWSSTTARYLLAGSLLYFFGSFIITVVFNVPLNNALDAANRATAEGHAVWSNYLSTWTFWNHIRTVASLAAMILMFFSVATSTK